MEGKKVTRAVGKTTMAVIEKRKVERWQAQPFFLNVSESISFQGPPLLVIRCDVVCSSDGRGRLI
jgi:hypothetical protein